MDKRLAYVRRNLRKIIAFPPKGYPRRTRRGYPSEVVYDQYSYERMVDTYREFFRAMLKWLDENRSIDRG